MERFILRTAINAIALWAAARIIPGIRYDTVPSLLGVALVFGIINALLRPILQILTCPLILLTLGLFTFVINAILLLVTAAVGRTLGLGFWVDGFGPAFWGSLVVSIVSIVLSLGLKERDDDDR
jgi:putative membrane protein